MKKSVKGIIGLSAALAVLGGGYAALVLTQPEESGEESSVAEVTEEDEGKILIHDKEDSEHSGVVKTVGVKNADGEMKVVQKTPATDEKAAVYTIDGYQDIEMNTSMIGTLANNANGLTSVNLIEENCSDRSKFGLESPEVTVNIVYESGEEYTMYIGNESPVGSVTYVMIDGDDAVYTVKNSTIANYSKKVNEFVGTTVLESPDETPLVESFRVEREDLGYDIVLEYNKIDDDSVFKGGTSASHIMKEPVEAFVSVERSVDIITGMFGLRADDVYSVHCTADDIAEAGLENPFCTVTMECDDGNDYTLLLSEPFNDDDNGKCSYAMMSGGNVIFTIAADKAPWLTLRPVDISSSMFIANYVWSISEMDITAGGVKRRFEISQKDPDKELDKPSTSDFAVTLDGEEFDSERFRLFYSFLISGNAEDFAFEEELPSGSPMATVEFTDSYNKKSYKFDFYEYSNMTAIIAENGKSKYFISKSFVETLIENVSKFDSGEDFATTWR